VLSGKDHTDKRSLELQARCLTDDPQRNTMLLGCCNCPQLGECGGLHVEEKMFDCLALCCGDSETCTQMCPSAPERFLMQRYEIANFTLENVPRVAPIGYVAEADVAELIYHGSKRIQPVAASCVALRLADLVDFRRGTAKYSSRNQLCDAFKIEPSTRIILSGVDHDARIEPWWALGGARANIIPALQGIGIDLVTAPNFSVVIDVPRADNLHAMKRIALVTSEFLKSGMPCALHPNGRTERDFLRWAAFVADRPEIEVIAYEFITGAGLKRRRQFHLDMLALLAKSAGRPLDIVVRGDPHVIPFLRAHYRNVIYVDTTAFVKSMKREKAERFNNDLLEWVSAPTPRGMPLDDRLQHNVDEQLAYLRHSFFSSDTYQPLAA
jgi:hypothetical protein